MTIMSWILLIFVLGGTALVWYVLTQDKSGEPICCGCGQCAISGECVLVKKRTKIPEADLTNSLESI